MKPYLLSLRGFALRAFAASLFLLNHYTHAQQGATGSLGGRVLNPGTGEYVKYADVKIQGTDLTSRTEEGGSYYFANVPVGPATVVVSHTGYASATATVIVSAGATATQDFSISPLGAKDESAILLSEFVVTSEREGDAKMIQERRGSTTIANVVTADSLGDITQGNIGDFLKYLPGFTFIAGDSDDPQFGMLGGMESQYMNVGIDGARMAGVPSDFNGEGDQGARAFNFTQISINSIDSISVERTVGAESDGDGTAGTVNLRTKSAFDRKGRRIDWQINGTVNSGDFQDVINFRKSRGPNDARSYKVQPGLLLGYSDTFFGNRLGVNANIGLSQAIRNASRMELIDQAGVGPINEIRMQDAPGLTQRYNGNVNLEYRLQRRTHVHLRAAYNYQERDNHARQIQFVMPTLDAGQSSLIRIEPAAGATNGQLNVANGSSSRSENKVISYGAGFDHAVRNWRVDGRVDYSRSDRNDGSLFRAPYLGRQDSRVNNISFRAERTDRRSADWRFTQLSGADWRDPNSWIAQGSASGQDGLTWGSEFTAALNGSVDLNWRHKVKLTAGISDRITKKHFDLVARKQYAYLPTGATAGQVRLPNSPYRLDVDLGTNLFPLPFPSREELGNQLRSNPEYFTEVAVGDSLAQMLRRDKDSQEDVLAYYAKATGRVKRLSYDVGYRFSTTEREIGIVNALPDTAANPFFTTAVRTNAENTTAVLTPAQIDAVINYVTFKYNNGIQSIRRATVDAPPLFRGSLKYDVLANTQLRFGYVEGYQQPNLSDIAGEPTIDTTNFRYTIPNPSLEPQSSKRFSLELLQNFEPVGVFSIHFAQAEIKNAQTELDDLTLEEALALDPTIDPLEYGTFSFRTRRNDPDGALRLNRSVELEYRQQFRQLPGIWRGLGIFGSYSKYTTNRSTGRFTPRSATGGLNFGYRKFGMNIRAVWIDDVRTSGNSNLRERGTSVPRYIKQRTTADLNLRYGITRNLEIFLSGKNITNEPILQYHPTADMSLERYINPGSLWTAGIKGHF